MFPYCVTPISPHDSSWPWHISQQLHGHPWAPAGVCLLLLHTQRTVSDSWGRQYQMGDLLFTIIHTTTPHLAEIHWSNAELSLFIFCHFKTALFLLIYLRLAPTNLLTLLGLIAKASPLPQYKILVYLLTLAQQAGGGCAVKFSVDFITCF